MQARACSTTPAARSIPQAGETRTLHDTRIERDSSTRRAAGNWQRKCSAWASAKQVWAGDGGVEGVHAKRELARRLGVRPGGKKRRHNGTTGWCHVIVFGFGGDPFRTWEADDDLLRALGTGSGSARRRRAGAAHAALATWAPATGMALPKSLSSYRPFLTNKGKGARGSQCLYSAHVSFKYASS